MGYDPRLARGEDWVMCCICFEVHHEPFEGLAVDSEGVPWDVCAGRCAEDAGVR